MAGGWDLWSPTHRAKDARWMGHPKFHPLVGRQSRWATDTFPDSTRVFPQSHWSFSAAWIGPVDLFSCAGLSYSARAQDRSLFRSRLLDCDSDEAGGGDALAGTGHCECVRARCGALDGDSAATASAASATSRKSANNNEHEKQAEEQAAPARSCRDSEENQAGQGHGPVDSEPSHPARPRFRKTRRWENELARGRGRRKNGHGGGRRSSAANGDCGSDVATGHTLCAGWRSGENARQTH